MREGRYRSTLIRDGRHLGRCLFYIDLNLVRAKAVKHPGKEGKEKFWSAAKVVGEYEFVSGQTKRKEKKKIIEIENGLCYF